MAKTPSTTLCPCGSLHPYADCCGRFIEHPECAAPTAEALMRSRYTAYTLGCESYLLATWQDATRPAGLAACVATSADRAEPPSPAPASSR